MSEGGVASLFVRSTLKRMRWSKGGEAPLHMERLRSKSKMVRGGSLITAPRNSSMQTIPL